MGTRERAEWDAERGVGDDLGVRAARKGDDDDDDATRG
jgi:hypothetical protein